MMFTTFKSPRRVLWWKNECDKLAKMAFLAKDYFHNQTPWLTVIFVVSLLSWYLLSRAFHMVLIFVINRVNMNAVAQHLNLHGPFCNELCGTNYVSIVNYPIAFKHMDTKSDWEKKPIPFIRFRQIGHE